jgi:hypothetical protein
MPDEKPAPHRHFTDDGVPITQLSRSEWYPDDHGLHEYRFHVGQSRLGFHGGLEASIQGGEAPFKWSEARRTEKDAGHAAYGMREGFEFVDGWHRVVCEQPQPDAISRSGEGEKSAPDKSTRSRDGYER